MKTPPLLLFATLLFWGWQSQMLWLGAAVGAILEASRLTKWRWELEDADFHRIWSLCALIIVALTGYLLTTSNEGAALGAVLSGSDPGHTLDPKASNPITVFRWLPLIFFPFMVAQVYNARPTVPLTAVSLVLRIRRRRGEQSLAGHYLDFSYAYFMLCVFAAGIHSEGSVTYFCGQCVLILWVLSALRSRRHSWKIWLGGMAIVVVIGFLGLFGVNRFAGALQNLDARLMSRFFRSRTDPSRSATSMGQIGELNLSPRIVIRLEPSVVGVVPSYLREASYRRYVPQNQTWLAGGSRDFLSVFSEPDAKTWVLVPGRTNASTVKIACYLNGRSHDGDHEGVLPLPSGTCRLENLPNILAIISLQTNQTGAALATGSGLQMFDARYGPGVTFDSQPDTSTNNLDLFVPTNERPALDQVIAEMNVADKSDAEKRLAINSFFLQKFSYSVWQGPEKRATATNTPLTRFLLSSRSGHCEYFGTATVLLLRELGIPARYAVGYYVHEPAGSGFVVRERDAHAWCLAWNRQTQTWEDFDTTPPSWVAIEARKGSYMDKFSDLYSWVVFQLEKLRYRQAHLREYILWTLSPVMLVLLYYIIFQRRGKRQSDAKKFAAEGGVIWPGHDSAFYQLEKALAVRGLPRQLPEPLSEWLERILAEPALADLQIPLRELLRLHYRYRFDPHGLSEAEKQAFIQNAEAVLDKLAQK